MTTLETNAAPAEASGEGVRTPEKAVRWAIPLSLLACVLLAFFDKISIAALFSDSHFQQAMGIDFDTTRLGILMSAFFAELRLLVSVIKRPWRPDCAAASADWNDGGVVHPDGDHGLHPQLRADGDAAHPVGHC